MPAARAAPGRWPRDEFAEAVWSSDLKPLQRLVAFAFADHARDRATAWVTYERLAQRTGLARSSAASAVRRLVELGWLVPETTPRGRVAPIYRLAVPHAADASAGPRTEPADDESVERTVEPSAARTVTGANSPARDANSPRDAHQQSAARTQPEDRPPARPARDAHEEDSRMLVDNDDPVSDLQAPYGRTDWPVAWCSEAIERAVADGLCTRAEAPLLLQALADDPQTTSPRRLTSPGGVKHARARLGLGRSPVPRGTRSTRPTWCGRCEKTTRILEDPVTRDPVGKCPRCHPDSRSEAA